MASRKDFGFVIVLNTSDKRANTRSIAMYFKGVNGDF